MELRKSLDTCLIVDTYVSMLMNCPCIIIYLFLECSSEIAVTSTPDRFSI